MVRSRNYSRRPVARGRYLTLAIAVLLVQAAAGGQVVTPDVTPDDIRIGRFQSYVDALREQAGIPGIAAAIVGNSDILWQYASGHQDLGRSISARPDTPFHLDGLTQVFTASMALRCVEEGTLRLDDRVGGWVSDAPEPDATIAQLLSHTSGSPGNLTFAYRPDRLAPLRPIIRLCAVGSYRKTVGRVFEQLAMIDSVPGPDVNQLVPPAEGIPTAEAAARYAAVLARLATPYFLDADGRPTLSQYAATTLTPSTGIISTARDLAEFMLALRQGVLLRPETLGMAWRPPLAADGQPLPHGFGWFVQSYNGETVVWQFGLGENSSSSLLVTVPSRGVTLILVANSDGLAKLFPLAAGDVLVSPFARLFLGLFVR